MDPTSTLHRPHIDPLGLYIDRTSTHTQLLFQPSFVVKLYPPTNTTFPSPPPHFYCFFFYLTSYLEDQRAKARLKWPNEGQTKVKRATKKIKTAKTRTKETKKTIGPSFVIRSLQSMYLWEMLQTAPPHLYNWDNCPLLRCLLFSCYPSKDDNLNRALYNEGYRCPVQKLYIDLLILHIPFLSDRVDAACFPVPPLSLLKSLPNRV